LRVPIASKHAPRPRPAFRFARHVLLRTIFADQLHHTRNHFFHLGSRNFYHLCHAHNNLLLPCPSTTVVPSRSFSRLSLDCRFSFSIRPFTCHLYLPQRCTTHLHLRCQQKQDYNRRWQTSTGESLPLSSSAVPCIAGVPPRCIPIIYHHRYYLPYFLHSIPSSIIECKY
jgi:hypothetical protein